MLDASATVPLEKIPKAQFIFPRRADLKQLLRKPGHLDLFSGCKIAAHERAARSGRWVQTYDLLHSPREDLLNEEIQHEVIAQLEARPLLTLPVVSYNATASEDCSAVLTGNGLAGCVRATTCRDGCVDLSGGLDRGPSWRFFMALSGVGAINTIFPTAVFFD